MQRYDDYEDLDEYEEDGEEDEEGVGEEEYEEEEAPQPTQEESEYLELRQRLKESIRKQIKKESGSSNAQEKKKKLPFDNYGSFFGPSQPVIAQRVIQESKSLLENQHLAAKASTSHNSNNKKPASASSGSNPRINRLTPKPKANEVKAKVQKLKDTRDYSFLLSDDAELPAPKKDPPPRNVSVPHSDARSAQGPPKSKPMSNTSKYVRNGNDERRPMPKGGQMQQSNRGPHRLPSASKPNLTSMDSRKQLGSNNGNGPGRPLAPKTFPSKSPPASMEKRVYAPGAKSAIPGVQKPPPSKLHSSVPKQQLKPKNAFREPSNGKTIQKQPLSSSRPQIHKPPAKIASRPIVQDRPKKKPARRRSDEDDSDDGGKAISMIREMFKYNPQRFAGRDDDDSDMEANFDDILREERRSAKIAQREDEEELRKIEEEERRERLRKEAKKRKLSQR